MPTTLPNNLSIFGAMKFADGMVILDLNDPVLGILRKDMAYHFQKFYPRYLLRVLLPGDVLMTHKG
jgi:hypothetical protein